MNCLSRVSGGILPAPGASRGLGARAEHKRRKARKLLNSAGLSRLQRSCGALTLVPPAYAGGWQNVAAYAAKTIHSHVLTPGARRMPPLTRLQKNAHNLPGGFAGASSALRCGGVNSLRTFA